MARTDGILSTGVSVDSAIVGMTAMVYVNGSAVVCFSLLFLFLFCHYFQFHLGSLFLLRGLYSPFL